MQPFDDLLFEGSPFLPTIPNDSVDKVIEMIVGQNYPLYFALALEVGEIGIAQSLWQIEILDELIRKYSCKQDELLNFMSGFNTPHLLVSHILVFNIQGPKAAIQKLCPKSQLPQGLALNQYKARIFPQVTEISEKYPDGQRMEMVEKVYALCVTNPFTEDYYYQAGIESSRQTYKKLFEMTSPPPY